MKLLKSLAKPNPYKILSWLKYLKFFCMASECKKCLFNEDNKCAVLLKFEGRKPPITFLGSPASWTLPSILTESLAMEKPPSLSFLENLSADKHGNPVVPGEPLIEEKRKELSNEIAKLFNQRSDSR